MAAGANVIRKLDQSQVEPPAIYRRWQTIDQARPISRPHWARVIESFPNGFSAKRELDGICLGTGYRQHQCCGITKVTHVLDGSGATWEIANALQAAADVVEHRSNVC